MWPRKQPAVVFWSVEYLKKLKLMILTTNVNLIRVNTRNSAVWTCKTYHTLCKFYIKPVFILNEESANISSEFETVHALKQNNCHRFWRGIVSTTVSKIKEFFGLFLNSLLIFHIKTHQNTEQIWSSRCWIAIWGIKTEEKTWLRKTINQESWKCSRHSKHCLLMICVKYLSGCSIQQNFQPHLGHWTPCTFPFAFCSPLSREKRLLDSAEGVKSAVLSEPRSSSNFQKLVFSKGNKGRCKLWAIQAASGSHNF